VEGVKRLALSIAVLNCLAGAFACWQTDWPRVVLATQSVNLRLTYNDKAQEGRVFRLHKAITLNPKQKPPEQFHEKKVLKSAITDSRGLASFGEVVPGTYWVVGGANEIALTVVPPTSSGAKRVWVNEFADGCINAELEKAD
jgi:hypothetical protein